MATQATEIRRNIRELKQDMKARGLPIRSMMNGGHTMESMRANERLFALKLQLDKALGKPI
jgi:hypothetical protein